MVYTEKQSSNSLNEQSSSFNDATQIALAFSPLDWIDVAGYAFDWLERAHIEFTMPEGAEKTQARVVNSIFMAIDAAMLIFPGAGGGGPALRVAMATSPDAARVAWKAVPSSMKAQIIKHVARSMNWSLIKTQQFMNVFFSANSPVSQHSDGSNRGNAADLLGKSMARENQRLKQAGKPIEPGWVSKQGYAAHHIVLYTIDAFKNQARGKYVARAQAVLKKWRVGINEAANGVYLPHDKSVRIDSKNGGSAYHPRVHRTDILKELAEQLEQCTSKSEVYKVLDRFRDRLYRNLDQLSELPPQDPTIANANNLTEVQIAAAALNFPVAEINSDAQAINPRLNDILTQAKQLEIQSNDHAAWARNQPAYYNTLTGEQFYKLEQIPANTFRDNSDVGRAVFAASVAKTILDEHGISTQAGTSRYEASQFTYAQTPDSLSILRNSDQSLVVNVDRNTLEMNVPQPISDSEAAIFEQNDQVLAQLHPTQSLEQTANSVVLEA